MEYSQFLVLLLAVVLAVAVVFVFSLGVLVGSSNTNPSKPKKKAKNQPKKKAKPKLKTDELKLTVPECALGKGFGYLRTLDKHDPVPSVCYEKCATRVCEACLDPRKAEKLLKEMNKT